MRVRVGRSRRTGRTWAGLAAALIVALVGCTTSGRPEAIDDPRQETTSIPEGSTTAPSDQDEDDVVWQEFTRGGFVAPLTAGAQVPDVTIYRDGRVFTTVGDPEGRAGPPVALEQANIDPDDLDRFLADAEATGLFDPGTDFGSPGVTDQPSTTVLLRTGDDPHQVDVYALGFPSDEPTGGVTKEQADRRAALMVLLDRARDLGDGARPYVPERVTATRFDPSVVASPPAESPQWPGPPLSAFPPIDDATQQSCLVIEGDDAALVYRADQVNAETTWTIDGTVEPILIVPLLPGQEGCPPS